MCLSHGILNRLLIPTYNVFQYFPLVCINVYSVTCECLTHMYMRMLDAYVRECCTLERLFYYAPVDALLDALCTRARACTHVTLVNVTLNARPPRAPTGEPQGG